MAHIAESQHWYAVDGSPCYEVKAVNGKMRPATLRDARKLNLVPSVTGIIKCAAAPGLERWKQQQVLHAALTLPLIAGESEDDYLARIMEDSREQGKKAAERGTAIHAAVQGHFEGVPPSPDYWEHVNGTSKAVDDWTKNLPPFRWATETPFACDLGFGGKVDLTGDCGIVVDFKTKEFGPDADLKTWDEHAMQLAAYRVGLELPKARCAIVYISSVVPGCARVCELSEEQLNQGWMMFKALLDFWQAKNSYRPSFEKVAA